MGTFGTQWQRALRWIIVNTAIFITFYTETCISQYSDSKCRQCISVIYVVLLHAVCGTENGIEYLQCIVVETEVGEKIDSHFKVNISLS